MAAPVVALVLVSHSRVLAQGVADVAAQMAPDVLLVPAGGTDDDRIGTDFDLVSRSLETALGDGRSAVVLTDLGSAALTTETVLEMADPETVARVRLADAPFVEGTIEAAVAAQGGADLTAVHQAAERAGGSFAGSRRSAAQPRDGVGESGAPGAVSGGSPEAAGTGGRPAGGEGAEGIGTGTGTGSRGGRGAEGPDGGSRGPGGHSSDDVRSGAPTVRGTAVLRNRLGLHARPAAQLARTAGAFDAVITVNGADARSVLALVGLNAVGGQEVVVAASGREARTAVNAVIDELENGFGEA